MCRNLVMHRDRFILVKHITEKRDQEKASKPFFRENYHGFPFSPFSPRKPFLMIYKILFCRLSFNLSNGGDVFGDWNHRLENWMLLISNLFRCWTFFFDWLCILFQYVEDKEYPCGEIKEEKGIQVICQSVLWPVGNFDLLATAEWKDYKKINEMEILGLFGGVKHKKIPASIGK